MNIDFTNHGLFSTYVLLLAFSGAVSLVLASPAVGRTSRGLRALNLLIGVGFLGYAGYLAFFFHGGTYLVFFKAFILPVLMIARTFRSAAVQRRAAQPVPAPLGAGYQPPFPAQAMGATLTGHAPAPIVGTYPVLQTPADGPLVTYSYPSAAPYAGPPLPPAPAPIAETPSGRHSAPATPPPAPSQS